MVEDLCQCMFIYPLTFVMLLCVLQTKSEAADELEKFRKASEEEGSACPFSSHSFTCTSPPVFTPSPPPLMQQTAIIVPLPPPVLARSKAATVVNTPMDNAFAREAMMEAIRSGVAAQRLKKVKYRYDAEHLLLPSGEICTELNALYLLCTGFSTLMRWKYNNEDEISNIREAF